MKQYVKYIYTAIIVLCLIISIVIISKWKTNRAAVQENTVSQSDDTEDSGKLVNHQIFTTETSIDSEIIEDGLNEMGLLLTAKYFFKEISTTSKESSMWGHSLPFTEARTVFSYEGYVPAGVNFNEISISVDETEKEIRILLPPAEILDVFIDTESFKVLDEKQNVFNKFEMTDYNDALKDLQATARQSALDRDLLKDADRNAEAIVRNFVSSFMKGLDYTITVEH